MLRRMETWISRHASAAALGLQPPTMPFHALSPPPKFAPRWSGPAEQLERLLPLEASLSSGNAEVELSLEPTSDGLYRCTYIGACAPTRGP